MRSSIRLALLAVLVLGAVPAVASAGPIVWEYQGSVRNSSAPEVATGTPFHWVFGLGGGSLTRQDAQAVRFRQTTTACPTSRRPERLVAGR
jgi:hypothetical protein